MTSAVQRAFICFLAVPLLGGCGAASTSDDPATVVRSFMQAAARGDGDTACGLLTKLGKSRVLAAPSVPGDEHMDCPRIIRTLARQPIGRDWKAAAQGQIEVDQAAGLDNRRVVVRYNTPNGRRAVVGFVQPDILGQGLKVSEPPLLPFGRPPTTP